MAFLHTNLLLHHKLSVNVTRCLPTAVSVIKADQHYDRLRNLKETLRNHGKIILRFYLYF